MNCCNHNKKDNQDNRPHKGHMSHIWMMVLCCGAPLLVLLLISLIGVSFPEIRAVLVLILPFICPVLMVGMIPMMFIKNKHKEDHCDSKQNEIQSEVNKSDQHNKLDI